MGGVSSSVKDDDDEVVNFNILTWFSKKSTWVSGSSSSAELLSLRA